jgi:hypothetical protein
MAAYAMPPDAMRTKADPAPIKIVRRRGLYIAAPVYRGLQSDDLEAGMRRTWCQHAGSREAAMSVKVRKSEG